MNGSTTNITDKTEFGMFQGMDILVLSPTPTYPTDAGNRKRIHSICSTIQRQGGRVHFVYYAFEWWFTHVPKDHIRRMEETWDSFHLVPTTIRIQAPPKSGKHHQIDEWWDPAIEHKINWLLQRNRYDAVIVNYPYLSRALDLVPDGTLKILDTHDKFSGRRELLERMGVEPEFFYTTDDQEKIALDRADIVWAIKEEEAEYFREMTSKTVITMGHAEPRRQIDRQRSIADEGYTVFGMVGARNSVNRQNAQNFFNEIMPILIRKLGPVKIRIGGGMCSDFDSTWLPPGVELFGRFGELEEFYSQVDAIFIPLAYSTGLKIKAVEAFALGMPVVSHRHAVEGIPASHEFHTCDSPGSIAEAMLSMAFEPNKYLPALEDETRRVYGLLEQSVLEAFQFTAREIRSRRCVVIAVPPMFANLNTFAREHVLSVIRYLKHAANITLYFEDPLPGGFPHWCEAFFWMASDIRVVFSIKAARAMDLIETSSPSTFPMSWEAMDLPDFCENRNVVAIWATDLVSAMAEPGPWMDSGRNIYLQLDAMSLINSDDNIAGWLNNVYANAPHALALSASSASENRLAYIVPGDRYRVTPFWYDYAAWQFSKAKPKKQVVIVADPENPNYALALRNLLIDLLPGFVAPLTLSDDKDFRDLLMRRVSGGNVEDFRLLSDWSGNVYEVGERPRAVFDLTGGSSRYAYLRETMERNNIPWLLATSNRSGIGINTIAGLLKIIEDIRDDKTWHLASDHSVRYGNDAGWSEIWGAITRADCVPSQAL